ncbi:DUF4214 domain-containing protein [Modestobacter sp. SSW1-42]|uniref:DUF4214 domain-containing protein n=1 Tax=Modestobacter sp. SSW1-42 TaxID=596372 RepID=UPI0039870F6D
MFRRLLAVALASAAVGVVPVLHAAPAQAAPASNDQIVQSWYGDFLDRDDPASDPGRSYWVGMLDRGVPRQFVLGSILRSYEYANLEVSSYYSDLLGRAPDSGAGYWIDQTANHDMAWEWVAQNVLASREFVNRYNYSGATGYIRNLYYPILGRFPTDADAGGISYWVNRYNQVGALNVVRELWYTDEAVRNRLSDHYNHLLLRDVDYNGVNYWAPRERQSDITVQVELASTAEYADLAYYLYY